MRNICHTPSHNSYEKIRGVLLFSIKKFFTSFLIILKINGVCDANRKRNSLAPQSGLMAPTVALKRGGKGEKMTYAIGVDCRFSEVPEFDLQDCFYMR